MVSRMNLATGTYLSRAKRVASIGVAAGLLLAAVTAPVAAHSAPADPVVFADAALETCVRESLNPPVGGAVTEAELATLDKLSCRGRGITDVTPLAHATGLVRLDLADNRVTNLAPLSGLPKVTELILRGNGISDIAPLAGMPALTDLYLNQNQLTDIASLAEVPTLRAVLLQRNSISDVEALRGLEHLEVVYLAQNAIRDISPLGGLTKLKTVDATSQRLPLVDADTGVVMPSPVIGIDGAPVPLTVASGNGAASGSGITWGVDGSGVAQWEYSFAVATPTATGRFSGSFEVNATTPAAVSLEGNPVTGVVGTKYSFDFLLRGTPTLPQVSIVKGVLPEGLALSQTGALTGLPTQAGSFDFEVLVTNGAAEKRYALTVVITDSKTPPGDGDEDTGTGGPGTGGGTEGGEGNAALAKSGAAAPSAVVGGSAAALIAAGALALLLRRRQSM
ncbi:hypothetical protein GCM10020360_31230 [Nonlabens tegetincola]